MSKWLQFVSMYWRTFVVILAPLVFLALPLSHHGSQDYCVLWLLLVMATFWVTEALPLVITSVLPIVFLPLMGIMVGYLRCCCKIPPCKCVAIIAFRVPTT